MSTLIEPVVTVADLELMPENGSRYEDIEGELFVSKAPGVTHQRALMRLMLILSKYLEGNSVGEILSTVGFVPDELNGVIPDLIFIAACRILEVIVGQRLVAAPDLVVEILSPGPQNERRDRIAKRQLYGRFGVSGYWILNTEAHTVEICMLEGQALKDKAILSENDELTSPLLPGFRCKVSDIFSI